MANDSPLRIRVLHVTGRYPSSARSLHPDNILAQVCADDTICCLRLDDMANPEMWLEIVLELDHSEEAG